MYCTTSHMQGYSTAHPSFYSSYIEQCCVGCVILMAPDLDPEIGGHADAPNSKIDTTAIRYTADLRISSQRTHKFTDQCPQDLVAGSRCGRVRENWGSSGAG